MYEHIQVEAGCSGTFKCELPAPPHDNSTHSQRLTPKVFCPPPGEKGRASTCSCFGLGHYGAQKRTGCPLWSSPGEVRSELRRRQVNYVDALWGPFNGWQHVPTSLKKMLSTRGKGSPVGGDKTVADFRRIQYDSAYMTFQAMLMIERHEVHNGGLYSTIMTLRDDSIVTRPYRVPAPPLARPWLPPLSAASRRTLMKHKPLNRGWMELDLASRERDAANSSSTGGAQHKAGCHIKNCFDWHGVANKVFVCARQHAHALLRAPWEGLAHGGRHLASAHGNSEEWTKYLFDANRVPLATLSADRLPIVVGRPPCACNQDLLQERSTNALREAPWCLLDNERRDCHPSGLESLTMFFNATSGFL